MNERNFQRIRINVVMNRYTLTDDDTHLVITTIANLNRKSYWTPQERDLFADLKLILKINEILKYRADNSLRLVA